MQPDTILTLAQYINDLKRRDRDRDRTSEHPAFDTTTEADVDGIQRDWTGDVRYGKNPTGKSGTHVRRQHTGSGNGEQ